MRWRWLRSGVFALLLFAVVDYLVLPQVAGTDRALHLLGQIRPGWVVLGVLLESASLVCYSLLTRRVLPARAPRLGWVLRADVSALGLSHVLPAGAATSTALRFRLFAEAGVPTEAAAVGLAMEAVVSVLVLAALTVAALLVSIPAGDLSAGYLVTAGIGAVVLSGVLAGLVGLARRTGPPPAYLTAAIARCPRRWRPALTRTLTQASGQVRRLLGDPVALRAVLARAAGNWLFDLAALWVFLAAYGHRVDPATLGVSYGLANLLAVVPITPGGLGVIEGVLIPSLIGFGVPHPAAVLGVISWRLVEFWAPIPIGAACYLSLVAQRWSSRVDHMPETPATTTRAVPAAYSVLVGLTSLVVLLQGLWAGIFLEHDGKRDQASTALDLHSAGASLAVLLALVAVVVATMRLRGRRDLWWGTIALFLLLLVEMALGQLIKDSSKDALTAVHVPLAMVLMGLCVWLPLRARTTSG